MVFVCKYINVELVLEYSESIDIKDSFVVSRKVSSSTKKNDQTADFRLSNFQNDDPHFSFGNGYQHDMDMEERPVGSFGAHLGFVGSFSIRSNVQKHIPKVPLEHRIHLPKRKSTNSKNADKGYQFIIPSKSSDNHG